MKPSIFIWLSTLLAFAVPAQAEVTDATPVMELFDRRDFFEFSTQWQLETSFSRFDVQPGEFIDARDLLALLGGKRQEAPPLLIDTIPLPRGSFLMGNTGKDRDLESWCLSCEGPRHRVDIEYSIEMGKYEVTNAQFADILNWAHHRGLITSFRAEPFVQGAPYHNGQPLVDTGRAASDIGFEAGRFVCVDRYDLPMENHPAKTVTWYGALAFCNWLSERKGLEPVYDLSTWTIRDRHSGGYRLPSEAEWEYACRGPASNPHRYSPFSFGDDPLLDLRTGDSSSFFNQFLWWRGNTRGWTSPVGAKPPNDFGLYDMHGNVWEWCEDGWYDSYKKGPQEAPIDGSPWNWPESRFRVLRGGDWYNPARVSRSAMRLWDPPWIHRFHFGLRVVRTLEPARLRPPIRMEMVPVQSGVFLMGSGDSGRDLEYGFDSERPRREVTVDYDFEIGQFEVTNAQYAEILNWAVVNGLLESSFSVTRVEYNGVFFIDVTDRASNIEFRDGRFVPASIGFETVAHHAVARVSWYGAVAYCNWLSIRDGRTPAYDLTTWTLVNPRGGGYRLPSEAEWEYACRGSAENPHRYSLFSLGDDQSSSLEECEPSDFFDLFMSWCGNTTDPLKGDPVGIRSPNDLGIHGMHGGVGEWCEDSWHQDYNGAPSDGSARTSESPRERVVRGGDWFSDARFCRSASRTQLRPHHVSPGVGFRVVRNR